MNAEMTRLIEISNQLAASGFSCCTTQEQIGCAFILNNMTLLPCGHKDAAEAWRALDRAWQRRVLTVKSNYMSLIAEPQSIDIIELYKHPERFTVDGQYIVKYPEETNGNSM